MEEVTKSLQETQKLGESFAKNVSGGEVIALYGDLGSGKTAFTQGFAKGLGITRRVVSPTFLILKTYHLKTLSKNNQHYNNYFYHADLYRISSEKDIESIGLKELFSDSQSIILIEWPEKIEHLLPKKTKRIYFRYISEKERKISYA